MTTEQLTEQLMALPLADRVSLAQVLWQSIDDELRSREEQEAIALARRRDADLNSDPSSGRTHSEVMRTARQALQ